MVDNTPQTGSATVATDDIGGVHHQRVKVEFGADGVATDVSSANPLPIIRTDSITTGTITATDAALGVYANDGVPKTGTPTAGSYVALALQGGESGLTVRFSGTFGGGTVWIEVSPDSTNGIDGGWITSLTRQSGIASNTLDEAIVAPGIFRGSVAGMSYVRFRITGATTPAVAIAVRVSGGTGPVAMNASLPPGANTIGALFPAPAYPVGSGTGTTPATTGQVGRLVRASGNVAQAAAATLIAAPAAGTRIYVTNIAANNEGAALTTARLFAGTLPAAAGAVAVVNDVYDMTLAASGGGAVMNFPPNAPWALPVATALSFAVTVATTWQISVTYYVAA